MQELFSADLLVERNPLTVLGPFVIRKRIDGALSTCFLFLDSETGLLHPRFVSRFLGDVQWSLCGQSEHNRPPSAYFSTKVHAFTSCSVGSGRSPIHSMQLHIQIYFLMIRERGEAVLRVPRGAGLHPLGLPLPLRLARFALRGGDTGVYAVVRGGGER